MATVYCDLESGDDGNSGANWANAFATVPAAITAAGAGGTVYVRRTNGGTPTKDSAGTRSITIPSSTVGNPVVVWGCADGTTAEPPTASDFETTVADQPEIECTAGGTLTITGPETHIQFNFMRIVSAYRFNLSNTCRLTMVSGLFGVSDNFQLVSAGCFETINMTIEWDAGGILLPRGGGAWIGRGDTHTWTSTSPASINTTSLQFFDIDWKGVDISDFAGATAIWNLVDNEGVLRMQNCKVPNLAYATGVPSRGGYLEMIGCTHSSSSANKNLQDYYRWDAHGETENSTETRTGGADDQSTGGYSLVLTPHVDSTIEGSEASVVTPWLALWVDAGSVDVTAYITNDAAEVGAGDVWLEVFSPNSGDTADHAYVYDSGVATDTSTWSLASDYPQKMSASITVGYTGWIYGRVHYAKRFASSPDPIYVDPLLEAA